MSEYIGKHARKPSARLLSADEVMNLQLLSRNWMEFKLRNGRIDLADPYLLKGHRAKDRMKEYGWSWRVWSEKPTNEQRKREEWKTMTKLEVITAVNEKPIWDFLLEATRDEIGTAAIMGNLMAESSLNTQCATGKNKTANYTEDADNGAVDFENDGVAFGLAQWCYRTRKAGLLKYAKERGLSVGNGRLQLEYLVKEMSESYKSVWKAVTEANDLRTVSDLVMLKYEKPANTSEKAKQKRADYGLKFLNKYSVVMQKPGKKMVCAMDQVNLRSGAGKSNPKIGELKKGQSLEWIATENGWHKVAVWVSGDYAEVIS